MKAVFFALVFVALMSVGCTDHKASRTATLETALMDSAEVADTSAADINESEELISQEPVSAAVDELFDDFIFNFAANRRMQLERIVFPLLVNSGQKQEHIDRKDWKHEHFFMRQDYYTIIFDNEAQMDLVNDTGLQKAIVEKIFLDDHFVRQYLFSRDSGRWMLTEIRNQTLPRNPNAGFLTFYEQFVNDSLFQQESLSDQIEFTGPDPDDDFSAMEGVITPDFWEAFKPDMPSGMLYNIIYGMQNPAATEKIFVIRGIANGLEVRLTFNQLNGRWLLTKMNT